jgi:hypothetical protein
MDFSDSKLEFSINDNFSLKGKKNSYTENELRKFVKDITNGLSYRNSSLI